MPFPLYPDANGDPRSVRTASSSAAGTNGDPDIPCPRILDGEDIAQGALADAAATAGGTGSVSAKLRTVTAQLNTLAGYLDGLETALALIATETTLAALNTKTPALGQALAAASSPVVLTALQLASLTAPVPTAGATGGATTSHLVTAATANATVVKASAGTLYAVQLANFDTSNPLCLHLYDVASAPTAGAGTIKKCLVVPAAASASLPSVLVHSFGPTGLAFGTGISFTTTTGAADANSAAVAAGNVIDLDYK